MNDLSASLAVGEEVGLVSYPLGSELLYKGGATLSRFGPLLQRGWIAALGPFDSPRPKEILLNLLTAGGASGGPVLRPASGEVVGLLKAGHVGREPVMSVAIPISYDGRTLTVERKVPFRPRIVEP